jgi:hypothetical protein
VKFGRTLAALVGATAVLAALTSAAAARSLSTSNQQLRATFARVEMGGEAGIARCALTLEGSFHERTTAKVAERLVGYVTRATLGACETGSATVLTETLPWHVRYRGFTGTLPNITSIEAKIVGAAVRAREPLGFTCLIRSTETEPTTARFTRESLGALTSATIAGEIASGIECSGARGLVIGTSTTLTVLNSTSRITISLI